VLPARARSIPRACAALKSPRRDANDELANLGYCIGLRIDFQGIRLLEKTIHAWDTFDAIDFRQLERHLRMVEITLPRDVANDRVEQAIDQAIASAELSVILRDTLKAFAGCVHWHVKNGRESGTLEITFWPKDHRAWLSVQQGRKAPWIDAKIKLLEAAIKSQLKSG
jgi:hypothetical protein